MTVAEMERRFFELKGKFDVGAIGDAEFKAEIEKLRFQDAQNRWWMIGAQSGRWYMYDGSRWIPGQAPVETPAPALPPTQVPVPAPRPVPTPAPAKTEAETRTAAAQEPGAVPTPIPTR